MGTVIDLLASIVAIVGVLAAAGYGGYLFMLQSVAAKRPGAAHLAADARGRLPAAGGLLLATLVGLLMTSGGLALDVIGLLVAGGAGLAATAGLQGARRRLASPPR